jgi:hypothetical protein
MTSSAVCTPVLAASEARANLSESREIQEQTEPDFVGVAQRDIVTPSQLNEIDVGVTETVEQDQPVGACLIELD